MGQINSYRDLIVWQKAMALVTDVYTMTQSFPASEIYGLTSQIRRCAVSVPSNIAEGYGRHATGDYTRFLQIAAGSLYELQTQIEIALNLRYVQQEPFETLYEKTREIERMLVSMAGKIGGGKRQEAKGTRHK